MSWITEVYSGLDVCGTPINRAGIAFGSLRELEYFLALAPRLDYCRKEEAAKVGDLQATTAGQLAGLIRSMRNR